MLDDVHEKVRSGTALSDAFAAHGDRFPRVYTASLLAGERSGNLDAVLRRYVEYTKIIATVKRKTVSALVYPAILVALALVLVVDHRPEGRAGVLGLLRQLRRRAAARRPASSSGVSDFLREQFVLIVGRPRRRGDRVRRLGAAAGPAGAVRPPAARRCRCSATIARKFATSQMARTLATLLGGGLPLVNALDIAAQSVGNQYMAAQLDIVSTRVREGRVVRRGARGAAGVSRKSP